MQKFLSEIIDAVIFTTQIFFLCVTDGFLLGRAKTSPKIPRSPTCLIVNISKLDLQALKLNCDSWTLHTEENKPVGSAQGTKRHLQTISCPTMSYS